MWVSSNSLLNLSLIGLLTMEIYYQIEKTGNTHRQTDTHTHTHTPKHARARTHRLKLILSPYRIGSSETI